MTPDVESTSKMPQGKKPKMRLRRTSMSPAENGFVVDCAFESADPSQHAYEDKQHVFETSADASKFIRTEWEKEAKKS